MAYNNTNTMTNLGPESIIRSQVCCDENKTTNCTQCGNNGGKGSATKNELLNFKMLRPIDHVLNFVIIFSVVSVAVLIGLLIFKKR